MSKATSIIMNIGAVLILVILLTVVGPSLDGSPTETEAAQDIAADKVQAPIDAAMVAFGSNVLDEVRR